MRSGRRQTNCSGKRLVKLRLLLWSIERKAKDLHIEFNDSRADHAGLHFQIDGEPSDEPLLPPSSIRIRLLGEDQPTRVLCKE